MEVQRGNNFHPHLSTCATSRSCVTMQAMFTWLHVVLVARLNSLMDCFVLITEVQAGQILLQQISRPILFAPTSRSAVLASFMRALDISVRWLIISLQTILQA